MDKRPEVNEENSMHEQGENILSDGNTKHMSELKSN